MMMHAQRCDAVPSISPGIDGFVCGSRHALTIALDDTIAFGPMDVPPHESPAGEALHMGNTKNAATIGKVDVL